MSFLRIPLPCCASVLNSCTGCVKAGISVVVLLFWLRSVSFCFEPLIGELAVHDPSTIVSCNGEYWLFATGRGINSRHSKDLVHWSEGPKVFAAAPIWTTN